MTPPEEGDDKPEGAASGLDRDDVEVDIEDDAGPGRKPQKKRSRKMK